jgi:hypothetical protein
MKEKEEYFFQGPTRYMNDKIEKIYNKVYHNENITFDEFITLIKANIELEFYFHKKHYGITQFDGYEIYEWDKEEGYQSYKTIDEFTEKATIAGILLKDAFKYIRKLTFA